MLSAALIKTFMAAQLGIFPLAAGKQVLFYGHRDGHRQVTTVTVQDAGFQPAAARHLAEASQDPDFYEWTVAAAHGQTRNDLQARTLESGDQALDNFYAWLNDKRDKIKSALREGQTRQALFWLGYALHGVQDLAPHRGMTNAEHAYLSAIGQDPDADAQAVQRAHQWTRLYLDQMKVYLGEADWQRLSAYQGQALTGTQKDGLLGRTWDLTINEYQIYKTSGENYRQLEKKDSIRWDDATVLATYMQKNLTK